MFVLVPYAAVQKKGLEPSRCFELAGEDGAEIVGAFLQQCVQGWGSRPPLAVHNYGNLMRSVSVWEEDGVLTS